MSEYNNSLVNEVNEVNETDVVNPNGEYMNGNEHSEVPAMVKNLRGEVLICKKYNFVVIFTVDVAIRISIV